MIINKYIIAQQRARRVNSKFQQPEPKTTPPTTTLTQPHSRKNQQPRTKFQNYTKFYLWRGFVRLLSLSQVWERIQERAVGVGKMPANTKKAPRKTRGFLFVWNLVVGFWNLPEG